MVRQAHQQQCDDLNSVTEHSRSMPNGDAMSLPNGWETKKLGDVCKTGAGGTPLKAHKEYYEGGIIPWLLSGEVSQGEIIKSNNFITQKGFDNSSAKLFPSNTVLVAMYGATAGQVGILRFEATTNQAVCGIYPNENAVPEFLYYYFLMKKDELIAQATGNAQPNISQLKIKNTNIPLPPLDEQKRIVAKLDECFEAIDKARANVEKNLLNAKELFQSKLNEIFSQKGDGWVEMTLGELGKVSMCKRILKKQTSPTGDIPFYKIGTFGKTPNAFINNEIYQEFKQKYSFPNKGDILISASGTIGRRVVYDGEPAYFQDSNIVWIENNEELILNEYLYQFYGVCDWNPSKGATISRLYNDDLRRIQISFPSIIEQKKLVEIMKDLKSQTQSLESNYQQELDALDELKKSILQKAFNGEL